MLEVLGDFKSAQLPLEWLLQVCLLLHCLLAWARRWTRVPENACLLSRQCNRMQVFSVCFPLHVFHFNPTCPPSHPGLPPTEAALLQHCLQPGGAPLQRPAGSRHCGMEHTLQAATARRVHLVAGGAGLAGAGGLCGVAAVSSTDCISPR